MQKRIVSREYKIFKEEERLATRPIGFYEKACVVSSKILNIKPDKNTGKILQDAINFTHLRITPSQAASLAVVSILLGFLVVFSLVILNIFGFPGISLGLGLIAIIVIVPFIYYIYMFPLHLKKKYEIRIGSEMVTLILYMAMYMRNIPSMEGAVKFASEHLTGSIAYEIRKLLWDVEIGNYINVETALTEYTKKYEKNREFIESMELLVTSLRQVGQRRLEILNEAVDVILKGNRERARHYNQDLKLPVMIVHAMGIMLPVMGLVLFPIVAIFLGVEAIVLFVGYDIILPLILFFIITNILEKRPATFSKIDISENPSVPPPGKVRIGNKFRSAWPIPMLFSALIIILGTSMIPTDKEGILPAVIILFGIVVGFAFYYSLITKQRLKVREDTRQIENEFAEAIFELGNQVNIGTPIELSIEHSLKRVGNLKVKELFVRALNNMKNFGMTFEQAFFDKKYGATRHYPSKLIKSIMQTIIESSKKGVTVASNAMVSISRYLKDLHNTQEEIKESLSETINSLKFQSYILTPLVSGIITTLAIIIIRILADLGEKVSGLGTSGMGFMLIDFAQIKISPFQFVMIVGIYLIETGFILSYFINGIEAGDDYIGRAHSTAMTLFFGFVVFSLVLLTTLRLFGPLIAISAA